MAVYERNYKGYQGSLTPDWSRFLVLPRYTFRLVFASKLFLGFFIMCLLPSVVLGTLVYLRHNLAILEKVGLNIQDFIAIDAQLFWIFLSIQTLLMGFVLILVVAPQLVSSDLANNALPLYLARPFNRTEYVLGKMSVLLILLSAISWVPNLLLFSLQSYLAGWDWFVANVRIGIGIFVYSWVWILANSLIALALSALFRNKRVIRISLFGLYFILAGFGGFLYGALGLVWGMNLNLVAVQQRIAEGLLGVEPELPEVTLLSAWATVLVFCAISLYALARKIRAYEEVK